MKHLPETKEKMRESAKRVWKNRSATERENLSEKLSDISQRRWKILHALADGSPICLKCAFFFAIDGQQINGECRKRAPGEKGFPEVGSFGFCGEFASVYAEPPAKKSETVIAEANPGSCNQKSPYGVCNTDHPCSYKTDAWECERDHTDQLVSESVRE